MMALDTPQNAHIWRELYYINQVTFCCECEGCSASWRASNAREVLTDNLSQEDLNKLWAHREGRRTYRGGC